MLCMARCSSQSTVLTSWVSHWPQTPPGRHINITNKASRTLGSGKNPEDRLLFSKRQGLQGSCHTSPGICKLYLAPDNINLINRLESVQQKAAWWTPQRCCRISSVNNMLTTLGWPYLQHRCRKARLVNFYKFHHHHGSIATDTKWIPGDSQYHKSPSFPFPVIPSALLSSVILTTGNSPFSQRNQGLEWPHWGCGCCAHPWDFLFTSSKISTFRVGHAPQVSSVDDG